EDEDAVGLRVRGEVVEVAARTEAVVGVVGADLLVPGGDHEILAWKALGEGPTPRVEVLRAPDRCDPSLPLRFPVLELELAEGVRRGGVVAVARGRPRLLLLDVLHGPPPVCRPQTKTGLAPGSTPFPGAGPGCRHPRP